MKKVLGYLNSVSNGDLKKDFWESPLLGEHPKPLKIKTIEKSKLIVYLRNA